MESEQSWSSDPRVIITVVIDFGCFALFIIISHCLNIIVISIHGEDH